MLALTCDTCGGPATIFFKDGSTSCNEHEVFFPTENDFGIPSHHLGVIMSYDLEGRYEGIFPRLPMLA